jgi:hypothetical protein
VSEPDIVYRRARETLDPILSEKGFTLAAECHYPESFGSADAEYKRRSLRMRLIWDGKDRWLWMTYAPQPGNSHPRSDAYRSLESGEQQAGTPARFLREGPTAEGRIGQLAAQLVAFLDRGVNSSGHG